MIRLEDFELNDIFYLVKSIEQIARIDKYKVTQEIHKNDSFGCFDCYYIDIVNVDHLEIVFKSHSDENIFSKQITLCNFDENKCFRTLDEAISYKDRELKLDWFYDEDSSYYYLGYNNLNELIFYNEYNGDIEKLNNNNDFEKIGEFNYNKFIADLEERNEMDNYFNDLSDILNNKLKIQITVE